MTKDIPIAVHVPWSPRLTAYDEAKFVVYLQLLDAKANGAGEDEMIEIMRNAAPNMTPDDLRRAVASHLARAVWMSEEGYRDLLRKDD